MAEEHCETENQALVTGSQDVTTPLLVSGGCVTAVIFEYAHKINVLSSRGYSSGESGLLRTAVSVELRFSITVQRG